jgi:DNA topoisomerase-1
MSSSEDDTPLVKMNGRSSLGQPNGTMNGASKTNGHVDPGVSIRFGPVQNDGDTEMKDADGVNGVNKRKARTSVGNAKSYAEPESSEEDEPLVRLALAP